MKLSNYKERIEHFISECEKVEKEDPIEKIRSSGTNLQYIEHQTEEICLAAMRENANALRYVHHQTDEICLAAVQKDGPALSLVHIKTEKICLEAVKQDSGAFKWVPHAILKKWLKEIEGAEKCPINLTGIKEKLKEIVDLL